MVADPLLHHILSDEHLTRGLGDPEARVLVEWLVEQAEDLMKQTNSEDAATAVTWLCRAVEALAHFVRLWCLEQARGAGDSSPPPNALPGRCPRRERTLAS